MTITAADVVDAYRDLLGREPESESVVAGWVSGSTDIDGLRASIRGSVEHLRYSGPIARGGSVCKFADFSTPWFAYWSGRFGAAGAIHRKMWEWSIAAQALLERGMLRPGARGLGFAVGQEPLASLFATFGVDVDATDIGSGDIADYWTGSGEHADGLNALHKPEIVEREVFDRHVRFFAADMRDLSSLPSDGYDFLWSSCALEHLGTLDAGMDYVRGAMRLLKPGGIAVHTTEFNLSSTDDTVFEGDNVLYREQDIRALAASLRAQECALEPMDFTPGWDREDILFDTFPWGQSGRLHIKLKLEGFVCTSALLICRRYA